MLFVVYLNHFINHIIHINFFFSFLLCCLFLIKGTRVFSINKEMETKKMIQNVVDT